jgi:phosphatidate cytidylyltransferase
MAASRSGRTGGRDAPRRRPPRDGGGGGGDLGGRILVAIPALAFAGVIVGFGHWVFAAGLFVLGAVCLHELFEMFSFANPSRLAGLIGLAGLLVAAEAGGRATVLLAFAMCVPLVFLLCVVQARHSGAPGVSVTLLGLTWVGLGLAHAVMLRDLAHGDKIVIILLVGTFLGDTGAYLGGRAFGVRKLAPSISPNKTVEGLLIGMLVAIGAVWFAHLYADWLSGGRSLILGAAVAVAAPLGDLFESYLKRDAGTKDTGRLFGPHGGALDRLDAVLFTAVAGFYVWQAML